jgi:hypothetical protein
MAPAQKLTFPGPRSQLFESSLNFAAFFDIPDHSCAGIG